MPGRPERTKIDISFYPTYKKHKWNLSHGYVCTNIKGKRVYLAHMVKNFNPAANRRITMDHRNRDRRDNRDKNLKEADITTQSINRSVSAHSTPVRGICITGTSYVVNYSINNIKYEKCFSFGSQSKDYRYEAWVKSKKFNMDVRTTLPSYRIASGLDDDDSSHGSSIDEENYEHRIDDERVNINSTSKRNHISKCGKYWIVRYYDEYGGKAKHRCFSLGSDENESLLKAITFRDLYEKYRPPPKKTGPKKAIPKIVPRDDNESIMSCESIGDQYGENSNNNESDDCSSNSDTVSMSEDEIERELKKIKNAVPTESIIHEVSLELVWSAYIVTYSEDGFIRIKVFMFGENGNYQEWWQAKFDAEKFKESKNKLLL